MPSPSAGDSLIPPSLGKITDTYFCEGSDVLVLIQDLHCHPEVQRNIARLLECLNKRCPIERIYVEGAAGEVSTAPLAETGSGELHRRIVESLVDNGELSGAEYYSLSARHPRILFGLEDRGLYEKSAVRLAGILSLRGPLDGARSGLNDELAALQAKYFNAANRKLERTVRRYKEGKLDTVKYYRYLVKCARSAGIADNEYAAMAAFLDGAALQGRIDYRRVSDEMSGFICQLRRLVPSGVYADIMEKARDEKRQEELYLSLQELSRDCAPSDRGYPHLRRFFAYLEAERCVDPSRLIAEERRLTGELRQRLATSGAEKEIASLSDLALCFDDYLANRITADDYRYLAKNRSRFTSLWRKYNGSEVLSSLSPYCDLLDAYYRGNLERNEVFLEHILGERMPASQSHVRRLTVDDQPSKVLDAIEQKGNSTVMIAGGFHTQGLAELLRARNVSYLVITPAATGDTRFSERRYTELAREQAQYLSQTLALRLLAQWPYRASAQLFAWKSIDVLLQQGYSAGEITATVKNTVLPPLFNRKLKGGVKLEDFRLWDIRRDGKSYSYSFMIVAAKDGERESYTYRVENGRIVHDGEELFEGKEQERRTTAALGADVTGFIHRLLSSVNEFLAQLGQFLSRPTMMRADRLLLNGTLARNGDDALSPLLQQALETAVTARRNDLGFREADEIRFHFLTFVREVNDDPSQRVLAMMGVETEQKPLKAVHNVFFTEHQILRRYLLTGLRNNSPPAGFTSFEQFTAVLAAHEAEEYLALNLPYSRTGEAFTAYLVQELGMSSRDALQQEQRTHERFHEFIEYLAQQQPFHPLAQQTPLLRLADALNGRSRSLEDAFIHYTDQPPAVRAENNYAFKHLERALLTDNYSLFAELFAELAYVAEGKANAAADIADLGMLLHEVLKKNPKHAPRLKRFLKALSADAEPVVRDGAEKVYRWVDVGPVVFVSPEVAPVSKAGGMANVVGELPKMLAESGLKVYVITPLYKYEEAQRGDHFERRYTRDEMLKKYGIDYADKPVQIYMGRQGTVSARIGRAKIDKVQFFLLANDTYADALYGQLSGDTTDSNNRATAEHWALRAQFLSLGALESLKRMNISPSIVVGNDWMTAPLMAHLNAGGSLYRNDPYFAGVKTIGWVHNNGQDYQFKTSRYQPDGYGGTVDLLSNLGLPDEDRGWFLDPHQDGMVNFMRAYLEHSGYAVAVSKGQVDDYLASNDKGGAEGFLDIFRRMYRQHRLFGLVNGLLQKELQGHWFGRSIFEVATDKEKEDFLKIVLERKKAARRRIIGNENSFVINMISRIAEQKGIAYVIPFVERVVHDPRYKDVVFVFGGPGEQHLTDQLSMLAAKYPERVKYYNKFIMGELRDDIFLAGDLFIEFSNFEPGGIAPMEGKASGNVAFLSNRQGHKSTVTQGVDGALFDIDFNNTDKTLDNIMAEFAWMYDAWKRRDEDQEKKWYGMVRAALFSDHSWDRSIRDVEALFKSVRSGKKKYYRQLWPTAVSTEPTVQGQAAHLWFAEDGAPVIAIDRPQMKAAGLGKQEAVNLETAMRLAYGNLEEWEKNSLYGFQKGNKIEKADGTWVELPLAVRVKAADDATAEVTPREIVLSAELLRAPPEVLTVVLLHGLRRSVNRFYPEMQEHDAAVFQKTLQVMALTPVYRQAWDAWTASGAKLGTFYGRDWRTPFLHTEELVQLEKEWSKPLLLLNEHARLLRYYRQYHEIFTDAQGKRYDHFYYIRDLGDGIRKVIRFVPATTRDWMSTGDASESVSLGDWRFDILRDVQSVAADVAADRERFSEHPEFLALVNRLNAGTKEERKTALKELKELSRSESDLREPARDLVFSLAKTHPERQVRIELNRLTFDQHTGRPDAFPEAGFNYTAATGAPYPLYFSVPYNEELPAVRVQWNVDGGKVEDMTLSPARRTMKTAYFKWEVPVQQGWVHYAVQMDRGSGWEYVRSPYGNAQQAAKLNGLIKFAGSGDRREASIRPDVFNLRLDEFDEPLVDDKGNMLVGTFKDLDRQLETIRQEGFAELNLQVLETGAPGEAGPDPSAFSPLGAVRINNMIGGLHGLLALKRHAEEKGLRVSIDMIPHQSRSDREVAPRVPVWVANGPALVRRAASDGGLSPEWQDSFARNWADAENVREYAALIASLAALGFNFRIDVGHVFDTSFPPDRGTVGLARMRGEVAGKDWEKVMFEGKERYLQQTYDLRFTQEPNSVLAWIIFEAKKAGRRNGYETEFSAENWHGHEARLALAGVDRIFDPLVANMWNIVREGHSAKDVTATLEYLNRIRDSYGKGIRFVTTINNHDAQVPPVDAFGSKAFTAVGALIFVNGGTLLQHFHSAYRDAAGKGGMDWKKIYADVWKVTVDRFGPRRIYRLLNWSVDWPGFNWADKKSATAVQLEKNKYLAALGPYEEQLFELVRGSSYPLPLNVRNDRVVAAARKADDDYYIGFFNFDSRPADLNFTTKDSRQGARGLPDLEDGAVYELMEIFNNEKPQVSVQSPGARLLVTGRQANNLGMGPLVAIPAAGIQVFRLKKIATAVEGLDSVSYDALLEDSLALRHAKGYAAQDYAKFSVIPSELREAASTDDRKRAGKVLSVLSRNGILLDSEINGADGTAASTLKRVPLLERYLSIPSVAVRTTAVAQAVRAAKVTGPARLLMRYGYRLAGYEQPAEATGASFLFGKNYFFMPSQFDATAREQAVAVAGQGLNVFVISRLPANADKDTLIAVSERGSRASIDDEHQARVWAEKPDGQGSLRVLYYETEDQTIHEERFALAVAKLLKDDRNVRGALGIPATEEFPIDIVASDSVYAHPAALDDDLRYSSAFNGTGYIYLIGKSGPSGFDDPAQRFFDAETAEDMDTAHIIGAIAAMLKRKLLRAPEKDLSVSERLEINEQKELPAAVENLLEEMRLKSGWGINVFVLGASFVRMSPDPASIARLTGAARMLGGKLLFEYPLEEDGDRENDGSTIARFMAEGFDGYRLDLSGMSGSGLSASLIDWIEHLKQRTDILRPGSWVAVVPPSDLNGGAKALLQLYEKKKIRTVIPYVPGEFPATADESSWPELRFEKVAGVFKVLYLIDDDDRMQQELGALLSLDSPVVGFDSGNGKYIDFSAGTGTVQYIIEHLKERIKKLEISASPARVHENAREEALRLDDMDVPEIGSTLGSILLLESEYEALAASSDPEEHLADGRFAEKYASLIPADSGSEWAVVRSYVDHFLFLSRNPSSSPVEKRVYAAQLAGFFAGLSERYQLKSIRKSTNSILPAAMRSLLSAA